MTEPDYKIMYPCLLCCRPQQMSNHRYEARYIGTFKGHICLICESANNDGIVPEHFPYFAAHLRRLGIVPEVNENGWIIVPHLGAH